MAVRDFKWKGRTEEEVKKLDLGQFIQLANSRARRSLQRGFTEAQKKLIKRVERGDKNIKTHCRDMVVIPRMVGMILGIYNGKEFQRVEITPDMLGHYLGEFTLTRKAVTHSAAGIGATRSSKAVSAR